MSENKSKSKRKYSTPPFDNKEVNINKIFISWSGNNSYKRS